MQFESYDYYVAEHWLPAIFNDDLSGLDDDDIEMLKGFLADVSDELGMGHWSTDDEIDEFGTDAVSNMRSYCLKLIYNAQRED